MVTFTDGTTTGVVTTDVVPGLGLKIIQVRVPATFTWSEDLMVVDLADYGARDIAGILAFVETTAGSIVAAGTVTTSVTGTTLTVTASAPATDAGGIFIIFAYTV